MGVTKENELPLYAAMLRLERRLCVVVGGGRVALRKVDTLLSSGARVRVISPRLEPPLLEYAAAGRIEYLERTYQTGDATAGFLIVAATDQPEINRQIAHEAEASERFVNVVDDPALCTYMVPATYRENSLQVAISTEGRAPAEAKRLRDTLASDVVHGTNRFQAMIQEHRLRL